MPVNSLLAGVIFCPILFTSAATHITSREDLPPFWDDVPVQLFYVESKWEPSDMEEAIKEASKNYHSGLAFQVSGDQDTYVLEFRAPSALSKTVVPEISVDSNGRETLLWDNDGFIEYARIKPASYWDMGSKVLLGSASGTAFNRFLCTLPNYKHKYSLLGTFDGPHFGTEYVHSSSADDFVWDALGMLRTLDGVTFETSGGLPRRRFALFSGSKKPVKVSLDEERDGILRYYKNIAHLKDVMRGTADDKAMDVLFGADYGSAYVHAGGNDYWEVKLVDPVAGFFREVTPLVDLNKASTFLRNGVASIVATDTALSCTATAFETDVEFWMWKSAALISFFLGLFFLYKAYHGYLIPALKNGKVHPGMVSSSGMWQSPDPFVGLTMSIARSQPATKGGNNDKGKYRKVREAGQDSFLDEDIPVNP